MASLNKVILLGNLGADPELRVTQNQTTVSNFNLATTTYSTDDSGNKKEYTEWTRVVVFGKQAENASKYLKKGSTAMIEGRLQTRSWDDEKTGTKRYSTEVIANNIQYVQKPQEKRSEQRMNDSDFDNLPNAMPVQGNSTVGDDLPF